MTTVGKRLRAWKLDELPQFINVLKGDMSIVGPRPDLEEFWLRLEDRTGLAIKPGVTGAASLIFINEEELLSRAPQSELSDHYVRDILPRKIRLDLDYAARASLWSDCAIVANTALGMFRSRHEAIQLVDHSKEQCS